MKTSNIPLAVLSLALTSTAVFAQDAAKPAEVPAKAPEAQVAETGPLDKAGAAAFTNEAIKTMQDAYLQVFGGEWDKRLLTSGEYKMPFFYSVHGAKPADGRALYIAMHGGGGAPAHVNNQQWENHKRLYTPQEGVYFVPRAPTDTWNLWHQGHIDEFMEKIIALAIIKEGVNPNKVYIMGYSAGGDGTYQLAPRMADRWAAAAMSAGHPGDAQIENLYNLPFGLYMGGRDAAYKRNTIAAEWKVKLADLAKANPGAYINDVQIYPEMGHWMGLKDASTMKWMPKFKRNPIPKKIVWKQDDVLRNSFYWLEVADRSQAKQGDTIIASYDGNTVTIDNGSIPNLIVCLNDAMMDLDQPVTIKRGDKVIFTGIVPRYRENIIAEVLMSKDKDLVFPAKLMVEGDQVSTLKAEVE